MSVKKIFIEAGTAIGYLQDLGIKINLTESHFAPYDSDSWVVSTNLSDSKDHFLSQGLSIGGGDRQIARAFSIFEALESLFFYSAINPDKIHNFPLKIEKTYYLKENEAGQLVQTEEIAFDKSEIKNSTGWAVGGDIPSACQRAKNEVIERSILKNITSFSKFLKPVDISEIDQSAVLQKIVDDQKYELSTVGLSFDEGVHFSLCVVFDPKTSKTHIGSAFGEDLSNLVRKSMEEVLMGLYFSVIVKNEVVGTLNTDFEYSQFKNSLPSVSLEEDPSLLNQLPELFASGFAFKVFPVQNKSVNIFVAQAL